MISPIKAISRQPGAVVQPGLRFAPGACEVVGSNPTGPISLLGSNYPLKVLADLLLRETAWKTASMIINSGLHGVDA